MKEEMETLLMRGIPIDVVAKYCKLLNEQNVINKMIKAYTDDWIEIQKKIAAFHKEHVILTTKEIVPFWMYDTREDIERPFWQKREITKEIK